MQELAGNWTANDSSGDVTFTVAVDSSGIEDTVTITNPGDPTSCWKTGAGGWDAHTNTITHVVCAGCDRNATGRVQRSAITQVIDVDYPYAGEVLEIVWDVLSGPDAVGEVGGRWPNWKKVVKPLAIVMP